MYQTKKRFRNSTNNNNVWRKYVNYYSKKNSKSKKSHKTIKYFSKIKSILKQNPELSQFLFVKKNGELTRLKKDSQILLLDYIDFFKLKDSKLYYKGNKVVLKVPRTQL